MAFPLQRMNLKISKVGITWTSTRPNVNYLLDDWYWSQLDSIHFPQAHPWTKSKNIPGCRCYQQLTLPGMESSSYRYWSHKMWGQYYSKWTLCSRCCYILNSFSLSVNPVSTPFYYYYHIDRSENPDQEISNNFWITVVRNLQLLGADN